MAEATNFKNNKTGQQIDLVDQNARDQLTEISKNTDALLSAASLFLPGSNELLYDDLNVPSLMVKIPKFKISDVIDGGSDEVYPAFIVNGQTLDYIYISKYENVVENSRAYSRPGVDPRTSITWTNAKSYCDAKGNGWHLMTNVEFKAIALWCKKNGFMPYGNNNYGKDSRESLYKAIQATYDSSTGDTRHVLTGSGPLTWSHNGEPDGIWDLNGNVAEWCGGLRSVYGELQLIPYNNAAALSCDQGESSDEWKAIDAETGEFVTPNGEGTTVNTIKFNNTASAVYDIEVTEAGRTSGTFNISFGDLTCSDAISDAAKTTLRTYGLLPPEGSTAADFDDDAFTFPNNSSSERMFYCGGYYYNTTRAGLFATNGNTARNGTAYNTNGFRSAYAPL